MEYDEANFVKILEYGKLSLKKTAESIGALLNLEYYPDDKLKTYTLSSSDFVIDLLPDSCAVLFVEDDLNTSLSYVQVYLNHYYSRKDLFFYLLKFFVSVTKPLNGILMHKSPCYTKQKTICDCVFSGEYCLDLSLKSLPAGFNIFTHRIDIIINQPFLVVDKNLLEAGEDSSTKKPILKTKNLSIIFNKQEYSKCKPELFQDSGEYYYEDENVKVIEDSIFIKNVRDQVASFLFKKGCCLGYCIKTSTGLKKDIL